MNPMCPNGCNRMMRIKKKTTIISVESCPKCWSPHHKPIILTRSKEGLHRCLACLNEFKPRVRKGLKKFWVCPKCHVKFGVGCEVIRPKLPQKPRKQIEEDVGMKRDPATKGFKRVYKPRRRLKFRNP